MVIYIWCYLYSMLNLICQNIIIHHKPISDICKERGLKKIWLTYNKHNDNTLKIYDHLGLQITDSQVADIGNGFVMDDYILTYEI